VRVFVSWSGERSKKIAEEFRVWLPGVIQAVKPYFTPDDIVKGSRWSNEIAQVLEESKIGIICLTQENLNAPWIMFEAGALSKNIDKSKVVPILFGVEPTDLEGPLVQFQAVRFEKMEIKKLVKMINTELGDMGLTSDVLDSVFEMWWPKLDERIKTIMEKLINPDARSKRSERELLEEILLTVKDLLMNYVQLVEVCSDSSEYSEVNSALKRLFRPIRYIFSRSIFGDENDQELVEALEQVQAILDEASPTEESGDS
jgi:hypothetical protein